MSFIKREPVVFWGLLTAIIEATLGLLVIFGLWTIDAEQLAAIMVLVAALGAMFTFIVRGQVSPTNSG